MTDSIYEIIGTDQNKVYITVNERHTIQYGMHDSPFGGSFFKVFLDKELVFSCPTNWVRKMGEVGTSSTPPNGIL